MTFSKALPGTERTEAAAQHIYGRAEFLAGKIHGFLSMKMRLWLEYQMYTINLDY